MTRSTKWMVAAGALGVPVWALPDAHAVVGGGLFYGLVAASAVLLLIGLAFWQFDDK